LTVQNTVLVRRKAANACSTVPTCAACLLPLRAQVPLAA
jgi:hypothetical protein